MSSRNASALRRRVLLSGTMLVAAVAGYGRRAYGACVNTGGSTFQCSGTEVTPQAITANNAAVSTLLGFSVTTAAGNAITITGDGALSYTDTNASSLTAAAALGTALYVRSGVYLAGTPGSVTINTNGALSGGNFGIFANNFATGALTITANGNVTGTGNAGIVGWNFGTNLKMTTAAGTTVSAGQDAIVANNFGHGAATVTVNGNVTGTTGSGISAANMSGGTDLTVTTAAGTTVSGGNAGITVNNHGTGALTVTANGNVTGTGTGNYGIYARNFGTTLTVTTGVGTTVSSGYKGIYAHNYGTGALTITTNGNVTGTTGNGIEAQNVNGASSNLTVTTAAGTTVSGFGGILASNYGSGALTVTANGSVTGTRFDGIFARNNHGTDLTVATAAGTTVSGGDTGIFADNRGTGALTITANGNVTGTRTEGIFAFNTGTDLNVTIGARATISGAATYGGIVANNFFGTRALSITVAANSTVSGGTDGINARNSGTGALAITVAGTVSGGSGFGIQALGRPATVTVAGTVNGGAGGAINFDQAGAFANRLELVTGAVINGKVLGGTGTDTLGLSGSGSGSFNVAQLSSFEAGAKTGSGSWTLTGTNAGIGTFAVSGGTLQVNGSLASTAMTVNASGTLGGTGTVGNTSVTGGTFAPGSGAPGSSMTVNGTLGFNAAATFAVNVNPTTSSFANVSGVATLGGATVHAIFGPGSYVARQYTILTAGSVSGGFGTLTNTNLPTNFTDTLSYDATHAYLNLSLSFQQRGGLNGNQQTVADALTNFFNRTGGIPGVFGTLTPAGLTQLSGESATGPQQAIFNAMNQFMGVLTDPFIDGRGDGAGAGGGTNTATGYASTQQPAAIRDAYAMFTKAPSPSQPSPASGGGLWGPRWSVWASGYGGSQTSDGNAALGSNTATSRMAGTAVGADYRISPFTIAGFALAGGGTSFGVNGMGSGRSDLFQAGAFIRHSVGPAYLSGALAYGWQDITTDRTVTVAGADQLRARFNANAYSGRVEGGYRFVTPWVGGIGITPYAAGQFTTFDLPAYAEQAIVGGNMFALAYAAKSVTAERSELGLRGDKSFAMADGVLTLRGRAAWAHDYKVDRNIAATFQTLPGASFVVNGAAQARDAALVTASAEKKWRNGWSVAGSFEAEFSEVTRSYAGKGVVRYAW